MNFDIRIIMRLVTLIGVLSKLVKGNYQFLSAFAAEVAKENYTYYTMFYDGTILLELTSMSGDCDLYVSEKTIRPTYDVHNHCLQSVTCGVDVVIVPSSFKRPLGIGVYGHSSHEVSHCILTASRIFKLPNKYNDHLHVEFMQSEDGVNELKEEETEAEPLYWVFLKLWFHNFLDNLFTYSYLDFL